MKIIDKRFKVPRKMVSEIPQGSCFLHNGLLWMKLDSRLFSLKRFVSIRSETFFKDKSFILYLSDTKENSRIDLIKSDVLVEPIDTKLYIRR